MDCHVHSELPMVFASIGIIISLLLMAALQPSLSQSPPSNNHSLCLHQPYRCGKLEAYFPFWGENRSRQCGGDDKLHLSCMEENDSGYGGQPPKFYTYIEMRSQRFNVVEIENLINYSRVKLAPLPVDDGGPDVCSGNSDYSLDYPLYTYDQTVHNITVFYDCSNSHPDKHNMNCYGSGPVVYYNGREEQVLKSHQDLDNCDQRIQVAAEAVLWSYVEGDDDASALHFSEGVWVKVNYTFSQDCMRCVESKGRCGWNDTHPFSCHCPDGSNALPCPHTDAGKRRKWILVVIVAAAVVGLFALAMALLFYKRRKKTSYGMSYTQPRSLSSDPSSWKDTEKGSQYFGAHLFTYTELEEATNFFDPSRELGDGGFGTVYYGQLPDGRCIAVKRLYENNYRRVEQFMNEIEILTRLRHKNLVSLFGCTSRHSRELLLVYEYIANGTVADHLHGNRAKAGTLPWHIRMNIAMETATALAYLHDSEIIHRDVKTNNILLDSNFVVKVADFGLSRLFPNNVTHVSTVPQGTPGYVDPEYHECYQLTVKSDVYSFGVVLVELISSLPAVDITRHRHEINLSTMAINKIQNQALHELVDKNLGFDSDLKVRKMINAVAELAFQCLQSSKDMRPSMQEVVDTLKDIQSDGEYKGQSHAEVMDISSTADDAVLLKDDPPPPSPASTVGSKSTTPNASG
ncbi:LEAF RUST 10 DISEASE-RESISTANCE LOCUS RECEPTOR-LIKE PROTEIN KINASE-like 1.2 isoform X4 [Arachis ipaensis]|uniref:LEAF RUST 10 DISEASE-RESISTANCE LOCUS RECEPTOR-LIKE PROTEIN KINASE-like 1.2 isoform X4 n=1 Tax=Arachis ipaensis TaxID=130454 RepID=UPI0007AF3B89|nr:LEAF RUST 10 DISEASE-RESISTANCE LOCUS RECEPTOR-LIKE PROTEIN KINASE-like 1.2 isoform X4 [Arachis ipaensis]XP_025655903.1 LEAF RUST 10 DISEASE-RESISTANCE LOCUS RECEPTOR-LIKE PROTEIN KINASE-like 1.2 isoform X3 [Arachis hypogaea]